MRNIRFAAIACLLILSFAFIGHVEAVNTVKYISNIDGLTNNSVNCIYEDAEHTIWIGTWDGLNAYNGREITTFRYSKSDPNSISNNIVRQILESGNCLWIATDNGVNRLEKNTHRIVRYYLRADNKIPHQEKSFVLAKSAGGKILCLVKGVGLFFYDGHADEFKPIETDFIHQVKDCCVDAADRFVVLFTDGTLGHIACGNLITGARRTDLQAVDAGMPVSRMFVSGDRLVLNAQYTLLLLNTALEIDRRIELDVHKTVSQVVLRGNSLYIGFIEGGCIDYRLDTRRYAYLEHIPDRLSVFTLCSGSQEILWIGTDGQGLIQLYAYDSPFRTIYTTHPVRCFCEDNRGGILVGTKGGGIKLLDVEANRLSDFLNEGKGLISNSVYVLARNGEDDVFIGTEGAGINVLNMETRRLEKLEIPDKYSDFRAVYNLYFTHNDSVLWVGTSGYGLIKMNLCKVKGKYEVRGFQQYISSNKSNPLNNDVVYAVTSVSEELWFGTRGGGLSRISMQNNEKRSLEDIDSRIQLTNNDVLCLLNDEGNIWIGTSYGLNKIEKVGSNYRLFHYADESLNNKTVHGILKDNGGDIWASTNQGLSKLNLVSGKIDHYTLKDGLQNDEFSDGAFFRDTRGLLYFGGVSGLSYFDPQSIRMRRFTPSLALSRLKIYNTVHNLNDRIVDGVLKLSYEERYVTLTFIAKDFINNENCEYAYRLANQSADWVKMGNNPNITFARLPSGKYRLEVKCTNGDKVWGDNIYKMAIKVGYPWWLSAPAWVVYGILCLLAFYIARSVVKNRIRLSRQILIARIERRHEQKIYESKLNFFTNVAHEFFTPLTLIYAPARHLLESKADDEGVGKYLRVIVNNAERMQKLIGELMEFRKTKPGKTDVNPEYVNVKILIEYISDNYIEILKENKIDFKVELGEVTEIYSDRSMLEKIMFNLLSNAFKYTPRNGYIHLWVSQDEAHTLFFRIRNSGKGLTGQQMAEIFDKYKIFDTPKPDNSLSTGIGLNLTRNLTLLLGGGINVASEPGQFVEFSVAIPSLPVGEDTIAGEGEKLRTEGEREGTEEPKPRQDTVVLIVEDDEGIRGLLKDILSDYTVREVKDGMQAFHEIERNHPDIIISDIVMPNMDGLELIDKLKTDPKTAYIPIVGISGKASVEDRIEAYGRGVDSYIGKPFHPRQVLTAVENLLSRQAMLRNYFNSSMASVKLRDGILLHPEDEELIQRITHYVTEHIEDEALGPSSIADFVGVSKATLYRQLKEITDKTPSEFVRAIRLEYAARLLRTTKLTVSEIMFQCGFSNKSYFYREFSKQYGVSPKGYRSRQS
ncbi:hybrid sensor histidine kinase/response regulator transcription factor [Bacteroides pyogenes]|uniref:hybrid sensor histidine kinase/response regulator transcription factor n=1 Tax=Bacteroides pyogenes TaxID=310300 RepID=UPI001BAD68AD|nr:hybrid sensor histidine kinase/response regulator transcription factor [Bacteroides pyogenes]MBR8706284.1 Sensor histidine kinase RcsC [Bacteroides pyogenes]